MSIGDSVQKLSGTNNFRSGQAKRVEKIFAPLYQNHGYVSPSQGNSGKNPTQWPSPAKKEQKKKGRWIPQLLMVNHTKTPTTTRFLCSNYWECLDVHGQSPSSDGSHLPTVPIFPQSLSSYSSHLLTVPIFLQSLSSHSTHLLHSLSSYSPKFPIFLQSQPSDIPHLRTVLHSPSSYNPHLPTVPIFSQSPSSLSPYLPTVLIFPQYPSPTFPIFLQS